jgi:hypothetical protein
MGTESELCPECKLYHSIPNSTCTRELAMRVVELERKLEEAQRTLSAVSEAARKATLWTTRY